MDRGESSPMLKRASEVSEQVASTVPGREMEMSHCEFLSPPDSDYLLFALSVARLTGPQN